MQVPAIVTVFETDLDSPARAAVTVVMSFLLGLPQATLTFAACAEKAGAKRIAYEHLTSQAEDMRAMSAATPTKRKRVVKSRHFSRHFNC